MLERISESVLVPARLTLLMWGVFFFEVSWGIDFSFLGILPRDLFGLIGIIASPLLHGSWWHIASNTVPFLFLGTTLFFFYPRIANKIFFYCYFATGILVWLFGRPSLHIGASGVIYGLAFFLIFFGFFRKDFRSLLISTVIIIFYGSLFYGLLPTEPNVSYESHLYGALVGFGAAMIYGRRLGRAGY
jgi:membrane associated rhomboid family serine protease